MQFESNQTVGQTTKRVIFDFFDKLKYPAKAKFRELFWYLGGRFIRGQRDSWEFPNHVSNETISKIIHNTCFVCGGLMKDSAALQNQDVIEISNGLSMTSHVYSNAGKAQLVKVRKCIECGHSHT